LSLSLLRWLIFLSLLPPPLPSPSSSPFQSNDCDQITGFLEKEEEEEEDRYDQWIGFEIKNQTVLKSLHEL